MSGETIIDFAQELRDAKTALARWRTTRKEKCGSVVFSIVAPVANHPEIQRILERIYQDPRRAGPPAAQRAHRGGLAQRPRKVGEAVCPWGGHVGSG